MDSYGSGPARGLSGIGRRNDQGAGTETAPLARMGSPAFVALCCLMVPAILTIVDHWMWLGANNGNANYMFFQCLAYNTFLGIILGQFTSASMQRDKALRLTVQKEVERNLQK